MNDDTEQHRRECEARYVLTMDDARRNEFYKGVLAKRGQEKANQLVDDVNRMRRKERKAVDA